MQFNVTDLELIELSLVDEPANPAARVVLFKNYDKMSDDDKMKELIQSGMTEDEAKAEMARMKRAKGKPMMTQEQRLAELESAKKRLDGTVDALVKSLEGEGFVVQIADNSVIVEKRAAEDYIDIGGETILKSALPAGVLAVIAKQSDDLALVTKKLAAEDLAKRVSAEIPHLAGDVMVKGAMLQALDGIADEAVRKAAHAMMKGANSVASKMTREFGFVAPQETDVMTELNKMANDYAAENKVTFAKAFADVTRTGRGAELFSKRNSQ